MTRVDHIMRGTTHGTIVVSALLVAAACVACGHGATLQATSPKGTGDVRAAGVPQGPPQYVVADPSSRSNVVALPLGGNNPGGALGLVVDKTRIIIGRGEPHVGIDLPTSAIVGAAQIPGRFGGGFLFWTEQVVYRADTFDGALKPLAQMPNAIQTISFAPKFLLVRTHNGERWALGIPSGERMSLEPLGAADVEGLDDGRALAFNDQGAAFASTDMGAHWVDITTQVKTSLTRVAVVEDELWLYESSGGALRLERDGQLSSFDKQPVERAPEMRTHDARWRGAESPLRTVFHSGASIDESTAIVVEQGDLVRVDVHSGEVVSVVSGKLPPDARCEAVPTGNDVLFACIARGAGPGNSGNPTAFVVSHTLSGDAPTVEQSFTTAAQFYGSDDGGLAFAAPCAGAPANPQDHTVCVRQPGGTWQDYDLSAFAGTGAAPVGDVNVARWVPRADGRAVAMLLDPTLGIYDPRTGAFEPVDATARDVLAAGDFQYARFRRHLGGLALNDGGFALVDWSWSFSPTGTLRGWQRQGAVVELGEGKVTRSPYTFDLVAAGPFGLGHTADGRYYQSTDHGATWVEVAAPPSGAVTGDLRACTTAGCDLGGFYRVGWAARPPRVEPPAKPAAPAAEVRHTRAFELSCRPSGAVTMRVLPRTQSSPDDLGLGFNRLPVAGERTELAFIRSPIGHAIANPLHDSPSADDGSTVRAMLTGFATSHDNDVLEVSGPNKSARALRRGLSFVPAFDPSAPVKKATLAMSEVIVIGRALGMTNDEILSDDMTESGAIIVVTPHDPASGGDLAFQNPRGLLAHVRANERVKLAIRPPQNEGTIISGVALGADESAFLELESSGVGHVFKMGSAGVTELFDVNPTANDALFYPANPDALAVGPRGELAVIRTGSGSDPPSSHDPALLLVPAMPAVALAPWSTLRFADDPACKEPGWRTTVQAIGPWLRISNPELRVDELPMIARVKWNDKRVCLEGVEVKLPEVAVRAPGQQPLDLPKIGSWLVSRGSNFARVAIGEGIEWRQPLECTPLAAKP